MVKAMPGKARRRFGLYWVVVAAAFAATITMLFVYTPTAFDETLGPLHIQKLFYVHLPSAINAFLACLVATLQRKCRCGCVTRWRKPR